MLSKAAGIFTVVALLAAALWGYFLLDKPVRVVEVLGELAPEEAQQVRRRIAESAPMRLLSTDLDVLRERVLALSWPRRVSLRRIWPDKLSVFIERETVVVRWGDDAYLSDTGTVVHSPDKPGAVPHLHCALASPKEALATYRHLQGIASQEGLTITALEENALGDWRLTFANGAQAVLGAARLHDRMHRALKVHRHLAERGRARVVYLDLRYPNGAAVRMAGDSAATHLLADSSAGW